MGRLTPEEIEIRIAFTSLRQKLGPNVEKPHKLLTQVGLADLLNCSWSTVARIETSGRADIALKLKVKRIHNLIDAFEPPIPQHERLDFLTRPTEALLGCRPIAFMDNKETFEVAKRVLTS